MKDIALHGKGLEQSQYISKESLPSRADTISQQGPQHDEAWLIFMDMVNNRLPSFEQKAEALHYFPMFRTWFGLQGLCKLPWNDIEPADNAKWEEPSKVPEHVDNYRELYTAITGEPLSRTELIRQSERVYNFQRVFNLRMGRGKRKDDYPPYRAVGPVTEKEYLSRAERYDAQLKEKIGLDPSVMSLAEKIAAHRKYREAMYDSLVDAVYKRRGWTPEGVPRPEHLAEIGMDLPELLEVVKKHVRPSGGQAAPQGPHGRRPASARTIQESPTLLEMDDIDEFFQLFFHLFQSGVSSRYGEGYAIYIVVGDGVVVRLSRR
jgi:aldehyde:ferredoxin oxidoreductase